MAAPLVKVGPPCSGQHKALPCHSPTIAESLTILLREKHPSRDHSGDKDCHAFDVENEK
jgi:hypothetical protein